MSGEWGFVAAAYALTWGTLVAYWGYVMRRARSARRALEEALGANSENTA
ncbi:MAG TPA: hypothetical protein VML95_01995 [Longimicrobiales bacterium]|nr:hypothetical protein [Longimicrobiales bacterium]